MTKPQEVKYIFISFIWLKYIWELFLDIRQYRKCKSTTTIPPEIAPVISKDMFDRTRNYRLNRLRYSFVRKIFFTLLDTAILLAKLFALAWDFAGNISVRQDELALSCLWTFTVVSAYIVCKILLHIYKVFGVENVYGFASPQSGSGFLWYEFIDYFKDEVGAVALTALCVTGYRGLKSWFWLCLWGVIVVVLTFFMAIWPAYIAPLFDHFAPFPEGPLKAEIEAVAASVHLPLAGVKLIRDSNVASHSYSYVHGCRKLYFVVYDVLIMPDGAGLANDEIVAVLTHELGHKKGHHLVKLLLILIVQISCMVLIFFFLIPVDLLYQAMGFKDEVQPVVAGMALVIMFVLPISNLFLEYPENYIRRRLEYGADNFCKKLQRGDALKRALIKLYKDNIAFPVDDKLYYAWYYDHPTLLERIKRLN